MAEAAAGSLSAGGFAVRSGRPAFSAVSVRGGGAGLQPLDDGAVGPVIALTRVREMLERYDPVLELGRVRRLGHETNGFVAAVILAEMPEALDVCPM